MNKFNLSEKKLINDKKIMIWQLLYHTLYQPSTHINLRQIWMSRVDIGYDIEIAIE